MTSEIDVDRGLVLTRLAGPVSAAEVDEHNRNLARDPRFNPQFRQLVDVTELTRLHDSSEVRKSAEEHVFAPGVRRALVAPSEAAFGMSRMFAIQSERVGQRIEVFRDMDTAKAWLDEPHHRRAGSVLTNRTPAPLPEP
jgi:hypothetical protein